MAADNRQALPSLDVWTSALLAKSTAGRGGSGKLEAYGIKKLRELILELAVRGKLVAQDSNDEPASELLKRIQTEKAKLIAEGKIKKDKPLPSITEDEKQFELPHRWEWVRLGMIGEWGAGATPTRSNSKYFGGDIPWFKSGELTADYISQSEETVTELALKECSLRANSVGDVLIAMYGATIGKTSILSVPATTNQAVCACTPFNGIANRYLLLLLKALKPNFIGQGAGGAQPNISREKIIATTTALPPLAEQHRIVAKVDELMALCDQLEQQQTHSLAAHQTLVETLLDTLTRTGSQQEFSAAWARIASHFDTLFTTEASIAQLKQTILQLAVMGKLVPQDPNDEPAKRFLKRKKELLDEDIPFKIPDSWAWARVEEIAQTRLGKMLDKAKNKGAPFRYLRNINVRWFDFDLSDVKEMRFEDSEREGFSLRRDDVLICEGGYPGRAAVWDEREDNIYFQKAIHRVRFENGVNPNYFVNVLRESADSGRLNSYFTGAGIQHLTGKGLMSFLVPLPPLSEQYRIVAKVDELMALCDTLKARIKDAQTTQLHLADAIVEQAVC